MDINNDLFNLIVGEIKKSSLSLLWFSKKTSFSWKLVTIYGSPYEKGKQDFFGELHQVMQSWQGLIMLGGDFNLVRFAVDKNNGIINHR